MSRTKTSIAIVIGLILAAIAVVAGVSGRWWARRSILITPGAEESVAKHDSHHGGCLNAIETCAVGHAEVRLDGDELKMWFVGGENETDKSVRVSDKQIKLIVVPDGGQEATLMLDAKPNELADEKIGDCSRFMGHAAWLNGVKKFSATGSVAFKGRERPIRIEYPEGYDPDSLTATSGESAK